MDKYKELEKIFLANGINFKSFPSSKEGKIAILEEISINEGITIGGSMTIDEIGIYNDLKNRGSKVLWHWKEDSQKDTPKDVYLSSTNALTRDGKLINMDGVGNRVASMINGYKRVFIIAGKNKIVDDYEAGIERIKKVAGPLNAKRLNTKTPCVKTGVCSDCRSDDRICGVETVIHRGLKGTELNIYLIDEDLGY